ncbi:hypothetical protein WME75_04300 [Sorangium sp. So ce1014]|uniref:hypothetical protein n=1 Tax=Sorangium sp. So ce1014 TaxID=3133326 RepID=UPI003F5D8297
MSALKRTSTVTPDKARMAMAEPPGTVASCAIILILVMVVAAVPPGAGSAASFTTVSGMRFGPEAIVVSSPSGCSGQ